MDTLAEERNLQNAVYNHDEKGSGSEVQSAYRYTCMLLL